MLPHTSVCPSSTFTTGLCSSDGLHTVKTSITIFREVKHKNMKMVQTRSSTVLIQPLFSLRCIRLWDISLPDLLTLGTFHRLPHKPPWVQCAVSYCRVLTGHVFVRLQLPVWVLRYYTRGTRWWGSSLSFVETWVQTVGLSGKTHQQQQLSWFSWPPH